MATTSQKSKDKPVEQGQASSKGGVMTQPRHEVSTLRPMGGFRRFREEMDHLFDRFFEGWLRPDEEVERNWDFDVRQEDGTIKIRADAPGFEPDDFDIQVRGDSLMLCACHESAQGDESSEERSWSRREFHRTIPLPAGVDVEHVDATYRQGVLNVTLPISEEHRPKHIAVKS